MVSRQKSNSEEAQAEAPPPPPPLNGRLVAISNIWTAVEFAGKCTSPRLRTQHRASARRMFDALERELARVRVALEALEAADALDAPEPVERQANLFEVLK